MSVYVSGGSAIGAAVLGCQVIWFYVVYPDEFVPSGKLWNWKISQHESAKKFLQFL